MKTVRWLRTLVIASLLVKVGVWGAWWAAPVAAESARPAPVDAAALAKAPNAGLPAALLEQSRGFRELLDAVAKRQDELTAKEKALAEREAGLSQLEKAVAEQVTRLEALTGTAAPAAAEKGAAARAPGTPGAAPAQGAGDRVAEITRIYESMKAEEAAPILDKLDDETLRTILGRMKERQIGAILAAMSRDRAVSFTKVLAGTAAEPAAR